MLNSDITAAGSLVTALSTQLTTLAGLTDPVAIAAQTTVALTAGQAARAACMRLVDALGIQRAANAKAALSALLDYSNVPAPAKPLEMYSFGVEAMALQRGFFADCSSQADSGLASYEQLATRWSSLQVLLLAEPNLVTG